MPYILAMIYSFLASLRIPNVVLWTLVILAGANSLHDTSQGWGMYHYFVGAKYFGEVGYFDLYECTITSSTARRNLYSYDYRIDAPDCSATFSPQRYQQFQQDIVDSGFYPQALIDKGYNGTPTFTAIFGTLANWNIITPANAPLIDIFALVIALIFCVGSMGWRRSAYIALIILTYGGTFDRLWGHYAQWVWLAAALVGVCQLERKNAFGAFMLGISTSLAIFPMFLMLRYRDGKNLILFGVGLMTFLTIGLANGRGVEGYVEFAQDMSLHSSYVRTEGCCNVGLAHTVAFTENPDEQYLKCFVEWSWSCPQHYEHRFEPLLYLVTLPVVLTSPVGAMFGLLTLSTYYYLILAVIPLWYPERWTRLLLFISSLVWMIAIANVLIPYRDWLFYLFFVALGASNVLQVATTVMDHCKSRIHPKTSAGHVGNEI